MTNLELAQKLRDLAQIYEDNPAAQMPYFVESISSVFCHNPEEWHATVRAFGAGKKSADDNALLFTPDAFPFLQIYGYKNTICEAVVVGKKLVPAAIIPETYTPSRVIHEHEEDVVEWRCRPFTEPAGELAATPEPIDEPHSSDCSHWCGEPCDCLMRFADREDARETFAL